MSPLDCANGAVAAIEALDDVVTPQSTAEPAFVHNCSRLGLQATPPTFRLNFSWFRRR
ncbi:hypothetical protein [Mycolicibacterium mengxianglii]|uniref:hypothetical protein n=1 Tax=Mycolicibacterium mengxianglii TaxID=2736649 RepID=UPI0018EF0190|nr:hypothetical protein [Mycolicibacterium mengxianglii]